MALFSFLLFLCLGVITVLADETIKNDSDLRKVLFSNYDKLVRPVRKASDIVHVKFVLYPVRINHVDVNDLTIEMETWYQLWWEIPHFTWDPADYDGLTDLSLPPTEVWRPDVALYSASPDTATFPKAITNVVIIHNGTVMWVPPFSFKYRCPFVPEQVTENTFRCIVKMATWTYDMSKMIVTESEQDVLHGVGNDSFLDTHEKWTIASMTAISGDKSYICCPLKYSEVKFDILFQKKRQPND